VCACVVCNVVPMSIVPRVAVDSLWLFLVWCMVTQPLAKSRRPASALGATTTAVASALSPRTSASGASTARPGSAQPRPGSAMPRPSTATGVAAPPPQAIDLSGFQPLKRPQLISTDERLTPHPTHIHMTRRNANSVHGDHVLKIRQRQSEHDGLRPRPSTASMHTHVPPAHDSMTPSSPGHIDSATFPSSPRFAGSCSRGDVSAVLCFDVGLTMPHRLTSDTSRSLPLQ
jgi:hypothetical protein